MKIPSYLRVALPLCMLCGASALKADVTTIVNDNFSSAASRTTGTLATDRANWFVLMNNAAVMSNTVISGGTSATPLSVNTSGSISTSSQAYMARWTPTTLDVGDTLTVSLTLSFDRLPASTGIRLGVFDSTPAGVITGDSISVGPASFVGDTGYAMTANHTTNVGTGAAGTNNLFRLGERTTLTAGNVFSTGADFTPAQAANGNNVNWATGTDYTFTMSFHSVSASVMNIDASLAGGAFGSGVSAIQAVDTVAPTATLDYILFRAGTGNAFDVTFKSLNVTLTTPVPEPSTYAAILGLSALALVGVRRRHRG